MCQYVWREGTTSEPGCIAGHVLHQLGVPLTTLADFEGKSANMVADATLTTTGTSRAPS